MGLEGVFQGGIQLIQTLRVQTLIGTDFDWYRHYWRLSMQLKIVIILPPPGTRVTVDLNIATRSSNLVSA